MSARPAPPPPSRPGHVQVVKAIYPYTAAKSDELSFEEGDFLYIIEKVFSKALYKNGMELCVPVGFNNTNGWWKARVGNKTGLIPSNYVAENMETIDNPLHEAAKRGNVGFLNECLQNKVSVNGLDKSSSTALHWAASGGHMACAVALLNAPNISLDTKNKLGDTALHNASWKGHGDIVEALIERGCNKRIKNNDGKFPYDLARNPEVAKLLKERSSVSTGDYGTDDEEDDE